MNRVIGMDYDNCYTLDPKGFKAIIRCFQSIGFKVYITTLRHSELDWHPDFEELKEKYDVETIFCDGRAKKEVTEENGISVSVWMDDMPQCIYEGTPYSPEELKLWRQQQQFQNKQV